MNHPRCVMIVDDQKIDLKVASRVLRKVWPDISVLEASNGEEAIELLEQCQEFIPDFILLDVNMPRMDGFEFLEAWYVDSGIEIPVVMMLTSSNLSLDRDRASQYACVRDFIVKPLTTATAAQLPDLAA